MTRPIGAALFMLLALSLPASAQVSEITITRGAGVGFLPLEIMEKRKLVEKHAESGGQKVTVKWANLTGSNVINDALLSGTAHFISGGPPGMLTLWDRTKGKLDVRGIGAISAQPMYLNTRAPHLKSIDDITVEDKIAVTAVKISIPAIIMQMYARKKHGDAETFRFDKHTVAFTHPDGLAALLSGSPGVTAHYTSPPFHQRERKDPTIRTIMTTNDVMGGSTTFAMMVTTAMFQKENPVAVQAVTKALEEAQAFIARDRRAAIDILLESVGRGWTADELAGVLDDPDIKFTLTPENVKTYADFMADIGSIKNRPASWKEIFFEHVHALPGS
jgi:NitT/TauT family transport system substrate-binding protein